MLQAVHLHSIIARTGPLYLDPGSGSLLLQVVLAAILGIGIAVRVFWSRVKALFEGKKRSAAADGEKRPSA